MEFEETHKEFFERMEKKIARKEKMTPEEILKVIKGFSNYLKNKNFNQLRYCQVQEIKKLPKTIDTALIKLK